jgi:dienelactone hydrolase
MTGLTPAFGRLALLVLAFTAVGCAGTPLDLVNQWMGTAAPADRDPADVAATAPGAGSPPAQRSDGNGASSPGAYNGSSAAGHDGTGGDGADGAPVLGTELAMLPVRARQPAARKPDAGRAICGALAAGARTTGFVESGGLQFVVECFRSKSAAPAPGVIILHGARGIGRNTIYERLAERLVERGHNAFIFQYLKVAEPPPTVLTGKSSPSKATPARLKTPPPKRRDIDSEAQTRAIDAAITAVQALSYVDHERIGLFGLSLGGFHALAIAARDERIGAVVDMFGAMPRPVAPSVERMPPTLILHGDRDAVVPVKRAHELAKLLKTIGATYELKIYKGQGHSFTGMADQDSVERSVDFLERWLGAPTPNAG